NSVCCIRINQLQAVWFSDRITQQSPVNDICLRTGCAYYTIVDENDFVKNRDSEPCIFGVVV
ncbi:hypothetical protein, partial [Vibrio vulnificus]|uniref:hypothetical protein n=1 Tax=Vibrio vulnificus TaxID=672 RepID=UPI0032426309